MATILVVCAHLNLVLGGIVSEIHPRECVVLRVMRQLTLCLIILLQRGVFAFRKFTH